MRRSWAMLLILAVSASALAAGQGGRAGGPMRKGGYGGHYGLSYSLPGGYALLNRLTLSDEQKTMLAEISKEYNKQYYAAQKGLYAKLPKMGRDDWRDPVKYAEWNKQRQALMAKSDLKPPVEKVGNVLTPEQLGKILKVNAKYEEWIKWLAVYMTETDAELSKLAGPMPEKTDAERQMLFRALAGVLTGANLLERMALTDEQVAKLKAIRDEYTKAYRSASALFRPWTKGDKLSAEHSAAAQSALFGATHRQCQEKYRAEVEAVLTPAQKDTLAKAQALLEARTTELTKKYLAYVEDVDKVLPPSNKAAGGYPYVRARPPVVIRREKE